MNTIGFWLNLTIIVPPVVGVRQVYKLADVNFRWLTFRQLLKSGFIVIVLGAFLPTFVFWIRMGSLSSVVFLLFALALEAAVYTAERRRHRKKVEKRLWQNRDFMVDSDEDYSFWYFHL